MALCRVSQKTTQLTYDAVGRVATKTDVSGYTLTFDYDDLDRLTKITFPDDTFNEYTYTLLDLTTIQDRAGRKTTFEYNNVRQMTKRTDPLGRVTLFQWCKCGALRGLTDPMGRTIFWRHDIQGRLKSKEYVDGSQVTYRYEDAVSRLSQRIDEKLQVTQYDYNKDDTLKRIAYNNAAVPTPAVALTYDANYSRILSMTDGAGTMLYTYFPITSTPSLGAGQLASVDGPLQNDRITFDYDELGRRVSTAINDGAFPIGVPASVRYDAAGRMFEAKNALGKFTYTPDGNSDRLASQNYPNGQTATYTYDQLPNDLLLTKITNTGSGPGSALISEFDYIHDAKRGRIASWTQDPGAVYTLGYDEADQLTSARLSAIPGYDPFPPKVFQYTYDLAGNRLTERITEQTFSATKILSDNTFSYNALNQLTSVSGGASAEATYEWDAEQRLVAVNSGNERTQFTYDGLGRRVGIRKLVDGSEVSNRLFVWCDNEICEERTPSGNVSKRFFHQGMEISSGANTGVYYYTRDHLGSIRELIDSGGALRARYAYDPFGRRTHSGDMEADFGFAGMFFVAEANLSLTYFRAYESEVGRWLSRDTLQYAELRQSSNIYIYIYIVTTIQSMWLI
jgi:RHS repeat-associated protein